MNTALASLQGYIAGCGGTKPDENPYHGNDELSAAWARGNARAWDEAETRLLKWMRRKPRTRKQ